MMCCNIRSSESMLPNTLVVTLTNFKITQAHIPSYGTTIFSHYRNGCPYHFPFWMTPRLHRSSWTHFKWLWFPRRLWGTPWQLQVKRKSLSYSIRYISTCKRKNENSTWALRGLNRFSCSCSIVTNSEKVKSLSIYLTHSSQLMY